ncbi:uncharacterized protein LOC111638278 [Centruroides sculpturatus]|uniref:uncharacterized protein LOC111638278 n=1 Tax=Centruroides sculpturatus TaxID=218467 RepID=UPI000C6D6967|nr:uncharacterized protein LOC111638278 [Centruroides sculpturatus]
MERNILLLSLVLCFLTYANSECSVSDAVSTDDTFPDIFDGIKSYEVSVLFTNYVANETIYMKEYYDISSSSGRIQIWRRGDYKDFRYFKETNEAFTYINRTCTTVPLDEAAPPFLEDQAKNWLDKEYDGDNVVRYLYGPSALLRRGYKNFIKNKENLVYLGKDDTVRSIPVDKWKECVDDDNEINYYFTVSDWKNPEGVSVPAKVPARITYVGKDNEFQYNQTIDFFLFKPVVSDGAIRITEGFGCKRETKNKLPVPKFIDIDHLARAEIVYYPLKSQDIYSHYVSSIQIAYHKISGLVMYRFAPWKTGTETKEKRAEIADLETIVWDNANKVVFVIDEDTEDCEIDRNENYYPAFPLPDEGEIDLLHPEILFNNEGFQYIDETEIRNIPAVIYEKTIQDMYFGSKYVPFTVITRYYSKDTTNIGGVTDNIPIRVNIAFYGDEEKTIVTNIIVINLYTFITEIKRSWALFDVSKCFKNYEDFQWFTVRFSVPYGVEASALREASRNIEEEFLNTLYSKSGLNPSRIARILVDVEYDLLSVEVLLVERPPTFLEFNMRDNEEELESYDTADTASDMHECTVKCTEYEGEKPCLTVAYCGKSCYMSTKAKVKGKPNKDCLTFDRNVTMTSIASTDDLLKDIKGVILGGFSLYLKVHKGDLEDYYNFEAISFNDADHVGEDDKTLRERDFTRKMAGYKLVDDGKTKVVTYGRQSLTYCRRICRNNPDCETISYCFASNECKISSEFRAEINLEYVKKDTQCVIFGRDYISAYQKHAGTKLTRKAEVILSEESENDCARMCSTNKDKCKSFDFCDDKDTKKKACLLHSAHIADERKESKNVAAAINCIHYSRKYIYDFKQIPSKRITGNGDLMLKDVDADQCAKLCVETGAFLCQSFDYCEANEEIDNRCILSREGGNAVTVTKKNCNRYYRSSNSLSDTNSLYSNGLGVGLGILFFAIGSAIGIGGTLAFGYYRANRR